MNSTPTGPGPDWHTHASAEHLRADYEIRDERGSRAAGAALGVVVVLAVVMAVLFTVAILTGCGSALADQCDALYAEAERASQAARTEAEVADARERMAAADAACLPDGGAR